MTQKICIRAGLGSFCLLIAACSGPDTTPQIAPDDSDFRATVIETQNVTLGDEGLDPDSSDAIARIENGEFQVDTLPVVASAEALPTKEAGAATPAPAQPPATDTGTTVPPPAAEAPEKTPAMICAETLGLPLARVKTLGVDAGLDLKADDILVLSVSGSQRLLEFHLEKLKDGTPLAGLCVFVGGNQNLLKLEIDAAVEHVAVMARGNQSRLHFMVNAGGQLKDIRLEGNKSIMTIDGPGDYLCPVLPENSFDRGLTVNCTSR